MNKAVVYREHTLGLIINGNTMQVLKASVLRGATSTQQQGVVMVNEADTRPATREDFCSFRVHWHPDYQVAKAN
jgi:hypothetical protein